MQPRSAGVLLHPTALPGGYGIGDLGPAARTFLDWLVEAGQSVWQLLPLGPPGQGDAPYAAASVFAGNPLLISPEDLVADDLLSAETLGSLEAERRDRVDFGAVAMGKERMLRESWRLYREAEKHPLEAEFEGFRAGSERARIWLDDWCLFAALKGRYDRRAWTEWPAGVRRREPEPLAEAELELADEILYKAWVQFLFDRQWRRLRSEAAGRGIRLFGDVPIYATGDSADVWAHQELFELDADGRPRVLAGVPPDAFSEDGQLWGQPTYRWSRNRQQVFGWWLDRLRAAFDQFDLLRLDHFRGFVGYWAVPAGAATAREGAWKPGPGAELLDAIVENLGEVDLVAEDLGVITPEVEELLDQFELPGMKVLQFAFSEIDGAHAPHRHTERSVVYTGTHDNDTTRGWHEALNGEEGARLLEYLGSDGSDLTWDLIRVAHESVARLAVVPLQDLLDLGSEARFNTPGVASGNWSWRAGALPDAGVAARLRRLTEGSRRLPRASGDSDVAG